VICESGDVAIVPFPFSERPGVKRRPALVLSSAEFNSHAGHAVLAMITTQRRSGLPRPCIVRLKLFTLDNRLLLRRAGELAAGDRRRVSESLGRYLSVRPG
jgi:mRNA interferase MazF